MQLIIIVLLIAGFLFYGKLALNNHFSSRQERNNSNEAALPGNDRITNTDKALNQAQELRRKQSEALEKHNKKLQQQRLQSYNQKEHFNNQ